MSQVINIMGKKNQSKMPPREKEAKEFDEEVLQIDRVTRVVKGGRRLRFRCLVAIGDRKGRVGIGIGKATEVVNGIKKAVAKAKNSLIKVMITDTDSIPHPVQVKYKSAKMFIMPASPGTGVIAGGSLRKILSLAGVKNVLSKNHGSTNKVVTAQASILALMQLRPVRKSKKAEPVAEKPVTDEKEVHNEKMNTEKNPKNVKNKPENNPKK
jgi:small subunit ribosomal protein S5